MRLTFALYKILILSSIILLNHGCSRPQALFNQDHKIHSLSEMRTWQAQGKMALFNGNISNTTNFKWQQHNDELTLNFVNSLGFGSATLTGNQDNFKLVLSNGKIINTHDGATLLANELGVKIPLASLASWLRGIPDKRLKIDAQKYNQQDLLSSLQQDNWQLEYSSYRQYHGISLPCKIYLTNQRIRIKIFITNWYQ